MVVLGWIVAAVTTVVLSFWGWLAVQVINQGRKLVELESRISSQESTCEKRLVWLRNLDKKLDKVAEGVSEISGILKAKGNKDD